MCRPPIDTLLTDARGTIEGGAADATGPAWENFVLPLAAAQDRLDRAWGQIVPLNAVVNTPALRKSMPS